MQFFLFECLTAITEQITSSNCYLEQHFVQTMTNWWNRIFIGIFFNALTKRNWKTQL